MITTRCSSAGCRPALDQVEASITACDAQVAAEIAPWARQFELLQAIPGVGVKTAQTIIAETGADMARFPSAAHLASGAGVAPSCANRLGSPGVRHRQPAPQMGLDQAGRMDRARPDPAVRTRSR